MKLTRVFMALLIAVVYPYKAQAEETLCAEVVIEIQQELALERQAFEARMRITNALDTLSLDNVLVDVLFEDQEGNPVLATSDPNNTSAAFFIRIDDLNGVSAVDGTGSIPAATTAEAKWLIVPGPNAAGEQADGILYFVGADLSYTYGGIPQSISVAPDNIVVKPQPRLTLDYFLTEEIIADDAFTPQVEPPVPYTLGVRVANNGAGTAQSVTIDSAQPRIVENEQALAISFQITQSYVNSAPAEPSLLLDFGDIPGNDISVGRWIMQTSLSGQFVSFSASFTHADELGGQLTSLLEGVNTHFLVRDVRVDLPGRDTVADFLSRDGSTYYIYESEPTGLSTTVCDDCQTVDDVSGSATLSAGTPSGNLVLHTLTVPASANFSYVRIPDPYNGAQGITAITRSDGRQISLKNAWISQERASNNIDFDYFINVFDVDSPGSYQLVFGDAPSSPAAPVFVPILDRETFEGGQVGFLVQASDPNGDSVALSLLNPPTGLTFTDQGDGVATVQWFPVNGQAGDYTLTFQASDGLLNSTIDVNVQVYASNDTDGDGLDDDWELQFFGDLSRDGSGDFDDDGYSDAEEFEDGTDPTIPAEAPGPPQILAPAFGAETSVLNPDLVVTNAIHGSSTVVSYRYELYDDAGYSNLIGQISDVLEGVDSTSVSVDAAFLATSGLTELTDNTTYYWRARGETIDNATDWANGEFFVNVANDAPNAFAVADPLANSIVDVLTPTVVVPNPTDVDGDVLTLAVQLFLLSDLTTPIIDVTGIALDVDGTTEWVVPSQLTENENYVLRVVAVDEHGLTTAAPDVDFLVSTVNDAPGVPNIVSPADGAEISVLATDLVAGLVVDPEGQTPNYFFELDTVATFDSGALVVSPAILGAADARWSVSGLLENTTYYWRVRSDDGAVSSAWANAAFFVNAVEESPPVPVVQNPGDNARVEVLMPLLELFAVTDPDGDAVSYEFEIYEDAALTQFLNSSVELAPSWQIDFLLNDNTDYWWRARAIDEHGLTSAYSPASQFFVNEDGLDDAPTLTFVAPATPVVVDTGSITLQWTDTDPDSDATIELYYDTVNLIQGGISEDADGPGDQFIWDVSALPPGDYQVSATISDATSSVSVDACCLITIPQPNTTAEVVVTPPATTLLDEAGVERAEVSVALSRAPATGATVAVNVSVSDAVIADLLTPSLLTFDENNWQTPQVIAIRGLDDCDIDGTQNFNLVFSPTSSTDPDFDALVVPSVPLQVADNEVVGQELFICTYRLGQSTDLGGTIDYEVFPQIENRGGSLDGATAVVGAYPGNVIISGNDTVVFGTLAGGTTVEADDAVIVNAPAGEPLDLAKLSWSITPGSPVSNLTGTEGNNNLQGTEDADVIEGLGGNDTLYGNGGDDTLIGGPGADTVYGGEGDDTIVIEGNDVYADRVSGGAGNDQVTGGTGDDAFRFSRYSDSFTVEVIDGQGGTDFIAGTNANNTLDFTDTQLINISVIQGLDGNDTIRGSAADDVIEGGFGNDQLYGNGGNDTFLNAGSGLGADRVSGGDGVDTLLGGTGDDVFELSRFSGTDTLEIIDGLSGLDIIRGTSANNVLNFSGTQLINIQEVQGLEGNDTITGSDAADVIVGGVGNDTLYGGDGDDIFRIQGSTDGIDRVQGDGGNDTVLGSSLDDVFQFSTFSGDRTVEVIDGNGGVNWIQGSSANNNLDFSGTSFVAIDRIEGLEGNDTIRGTSGNDLIVGGPGRDTLRGGAGDDVFSLVNNDDADRVDGGDGTDTLLGVDGDETILLSTFNGDYRVEIVDGGSGVNVIQGTTANNNFDFSATTLTNIARIEGLAGNDTLRGSPGNDVIVGGPGADRVYGNAGDDTFLLTDTDGAADRFDGGDGFDVLLGNDGDTNIVLSLHRDATTVERIDGGSGVNVIQGTAANNNLNFSGTELLNIARIEGLEGHDTLEGSASADVIVGGPGADTVRGGDGDDTFLYEGNDDSADRYDGGNGVDTLLGTTADDLIRLKSHDGAYVVDVIDGLGGVNVIAGTTANNKLDFTNTQLLNIARIEGQEGNDTLMGSATNDVLVGGIGTDTVYGNGGDDQILWSGADTSADRVSGGDGFDTFSGTTGDDVLRLSSHSGVFVVDRVVGGGGTDTLVGTAANNNLDFTNTELVGIASIDGLAGNDTLRGSSAADVIIGGPGADKIYGNDGDDTFLLTGADASADRYDGGGGVDTLQGSSADEIIVLSTHTGTNTVDIIDGGGGFDTVAGTDSNNNLNFSATQLVGIARIDGRGGNDTLTGSASADLIVGGLGNDTMVGGDGSDTYLVGMNEGSDTIRDEGSVADADLLRYVAGVDYTQLWFYRSGSTLYIYQLGTTSYVRMTNWFITPENQLEGIETVDRQITGADIEALTNVMTPMGSPVNGVITLTAQQQADVAAAQANYWQAL